jgi:hemoglobin
MRHVPFTITQAARDRWIELMRQALDEAQVQPDAKEVLSSFFDSTATFLINSMAEH